MDKIRARTLNTDIRDVSVVIPAHNEEATIASVVASSLDSLATLKVDGEVIVSASGCTDKTTTLATSAGARVVEAPLGKGAAILSGVSEAQGGVVCLVDGDLDYYGQTPLVQLLVEPILRGIADATIANLYWRPIYPDQWLNGFFAPLAGHFLPEILPKVGSTPWSGQRAALRPLWPTSLPDGFTSDLAIILHWNQHALQLRPVLTDDWYNPIRPKPELLAQDFSLFVEHLVRIGRLDPDMRGNLAVWFNAVEKMIHAYNADRDDPMVYQRTLLEFSHKELCRQTADGPTGEMC